MRTLALAVAAALLAGCAGSVPRAGGVPIPGMSGLLIGGRFLLPTGETRNGRLVINLEGEGGRLAEVYRLPVYAKQAVLYQIEPGLYRVTPARNRFGLYGQTVKVRMDGRTYHAPFPRELLRIGAMDARSRKIIPLGVIEAKLSAALPGQKPILKVRLDDSIAARRQLVQDVIRDMMDPNTPLETREGAIAWSRALENSLMELLSESERHPLYKKAQ